MLVSGVPALILCIILEKTTGLRVSPEAERLGLDVVHWGTSNYADDLLPPSIAPARA